MAMDEYCPTELVLPTAVILDGIAPPEFVGVAVGDMAVLLVNSNQSGEYAMLGSSSLTLIRMVVVLEPPELFA